MIENKTMKKKYVYWQDDDMWLGYLEEYPDYWTQGETEEELQENLLDIYQLMNIITKETDPHPTENIQLLQ